MASNPAPEPRKKTERPPGRKRKRFLYEKRVLLLTILCSIPALVAFTVMMWMIPWRNETRVSVLALLLIVDLILILILHDNIIRPIQTLTNVVAALREENYSFRARGAGQEDALGELALEINSL